jgi:hypothetical protein
VNIFLTFDYELFFGENSGSVEKCMLEPTNDLLRIAEERNVRYTFFVDVGYIVRAEEYPELKEELASVIAQLKKVVELGHDLQLHVHPHWEKAELKNGFWQMNTVGNYKLVDFSQEEARDILTRYKAKLEEVKGCEVNAFRAGGWCVQPFEFIADAMKDLGIKFDTSVIADFQLFTDNYALNFIGAPRKESYSFETDVCKEEIGGSFREYPITSYRYSPFFYWSLYLKGKLNKKRHRMIGDGNFISHGSKKWKQLFFYNTMHVSSDGYDLKRAYVLNTLIW